MSQIVHAQINEFTINLTESGFDPLMSWELRVYDGNGLETYWSSHFSVGSAIEAFTHKISDIMRSTIS